MTPERCYIIHRSSEFSKEEGLQTEEWYDSKYKIESISDQNLKEWNEALPTKDDQLDHPPRNKFAPKEFPKIKMAERKGSPG